METFLAISVLAAVFVLGALISAGNERQRKAIDGIREQAEGWAEQDIRIKREKLARQITVAEPLAWLEKVAAQALGNAPKLVTATPWQKEGLNAIVGLCQDGRHLVFTPIPRERLLQSLKVKGKSALAGMSGTLLGDQPKRTPFFDLSVVTSGMFFDIEAAQTWQALTGEPLTSGRLTMYEVAALGNGKK
jgi:hypothetical protein